MQSHNGIFQRAASALVVAAVFCHLVARPASAASSCDPIITFADGLQPAREIHVNAIAGSGPEAGTDGTAAKPFRSIQEAVQGARPGDAIRIWPGVYPGGLSPRGLNGEPGRPIWLGGIQGKERPVLKGASSGIHLSKCSYLIIENLEIDGASGNGINCDDGADYGNTNAAHHLIFRHLKINNAGRGGNQDGLKLSGINHFFVLNCEFDRISQGGSSIDHVGCHHGVVANCLFGETGNGVQCKGGSEDILIHGNRFHQSRGRAINVGGSTGFQFFRPPLSTNQPNYEARNIRVVANLFRGSDSPIAFVGAVDSVAAHNTIVDPGRWVVRILQETTSKAPHIFVPSSRNRIFNNIIYYQRSKVRLPINVGANTEPETFEFSHNLWYAPDRPGQSHPAFPAEEASGLYGMDPLFQDASNHDYSIPANSPAARKGKPSGFVKADLRGECFGNPPSLGAFEANGLKAGNGK